MLSLILTFKVFSKVNISFIFLFQNEIYYFKLQYVDKFLNLAIFSYLIAYCNKFCFNFKY